MIKAILFDLDNTLHDFIKTKQICCEAAIRAMQENGLKISKTKALKLIFKIYKKFGIEYTKVFQVFLLQTLKKIDWRMLAAAIVAYRKAQNGILPLYPKVITTLLKLKEMGIKLGIVTNAPRIKAWIRLTELQLQDFFDFVICKEDSGEEKPSQLPFKLAIKKLNLEPREILMIGDNPEQDIKGAKKLGIKTCFAKYGYAFKKKPKIKADYTAQSFEEILKIVKKCE